MIQGAILRNELPPRLWPIEQTHALTFASRYDELAERAYARAAYCASVDFREPAKRLQADAAHYSKQARKYRFLLIGADPE